MPIIELPPPWEVRDGLFSYYDDERGKWLSVDRTTFTFSRGRKNIPDPQWLPYGDSVPGSLSGPDLFRSGCITSISVRCSDPASAVFRIRKNGVASDVETITLSSSSGGRRTDVNVDLDAGDWLGCYMEPTTGSVSMPVVLVEVAWRT